MGQELKNNEYKQVNSRNSGQMNFKKLQSAKTKSLQMKRGTIMEIIQKQREIEQHNKKVPKNDKKGISINNVIVPSQKVKLKINKFTDSTNNNYNILSFKTGCGTSACESPLMHPS